MKPVNEIFGKASGKALKAVTDGNMTLKYWCDLPSENNAALDSNLHYEEIRLKSFENWPVTFLEPEVLARNGFYYLGCGDEVRCAFCKVEIMRWEMFDDPAKDHQRWAPQCPFLRNPATSGNVGIKPAVTVGHEKENKYGPVHPEYASEAARFETFNEWPKSLRQKPKELAEAGFFYTGNSDKTMCFHCSGGLRDWESDDVPWEQHALWFDQCPYLQQVKGRDYIKKIISKYRVEENGTNTSKPIPAYLALSMRQLCYTIFLLLSNTFSATYSELRQIIVSYGAQLFNWIRIPIESVILRLISLNSRSRSLTQENCRKLFFALAFALVLLPRVTGENQIGVKSWHWSFPGYNLSIFKQLLSAF